MEVSVVIPVYNEAETLASVLMEVKKLSGITEIIAVLNGCTDDSRDIATAYEGVRVLEFRQRLGYDVPRMVGARAAIGSHLLFIDSDFSVLAHDLRPFLRAASEGADLALNDAFRRYTVGTGCTSVVMAHQFLNFAIQRPDLGTASLTVVPHVISRVGLDRIGYDCLRVPPLALVKAVLAGLDIQIAASIDVHRVNPRRASQYVTQLILGDHLEALSYLSSEIGSRCRFPPKARDDKTLP